MLHSELNKAESAENQDDCEKILDESHMSCTLRDKVITTAIEEYNYSGEATDLCQDVPRWLQHCVRDIRECKNDDAVKLVLCRFVICTASTDKSSPIRFLFRSDALRFLGVLGRQSELLWEERSWKPFGHNTKRQEMLQRILQEVAKYCACPLALEAQHDYRMQEYERAAKLYWDYAVTCDLLNKQRLAGEAYHQSCRAYLQVGAWREATNAGKKARRRYRQARSDQFEIAHYDSMTDVLTNIGTAYAKLNYNHLAKKYFKRAMALCRKYRLKGVDEPLAELVAVYGKTKGYYHADYRLHQYAKRCQNVGYVRGVAAAFYHRGTAFESEAQYDDALRSYSRSVGIYHAEVKDQEKVAEVLAHGKTMLVSCTTSGVIQQFEACFRLGAVDGAAVITQKQGVGVKKLSVVVT